jgi:hypothetical protein
VPYLATAFNSTVKMLIAKLLYLTLIGVAEVMGSAFTLQVVDPIKKSEVSSECYDVYSAEVAICGHTTTPTCSAECILTLATLSVNIQQACSGAVVTKGTILRSTLEGGLLPALCTILKPPTEVPNSVLGLLYTTATKKYTAKPIDFDVKTDSIVNHAATISTTLLLKSSGVDTIPTATHGLPSVPVDQLTHPESSAPSVTSIPTEDNANRKLVTFDWLLLPAVVGVLAPLI